MEDDKNQQTRENNIEDIAAIVTEESIADVRALIFGSATFTPTQLMTQTLHDYLGDEEGLTPQAILRKNGRSADNWWLWPKRHKGFTEWWNGIINNICSEHKIHDLYKALYKRGLSNDTAATKIFLQRYDKNYVERTQQDQRLSFQGYEPADADSSRDRQRKAIASRELALPVPQDGPQSTIRALPIPEHPPQSDTRALQVYGLPAPATQAQVQGAEPIEPVQAQVVDDTHVANKDTGEQSGAGGPL